ncbi:MAG TPA: hypothetical protein VG367_20055 [Mucilaginibacter sp.]|jgi:hypothetical protein|nr:hypothetical protein [Mucilaginibacter sp.]
MKLLLITLCCIFIQVGPSTPRFQGSYSRFYDSGKKRYKPDGFLKIHYISKDNILFYLEAWRMLDMNSGAMYGKLTLNKKSGKYEYLPKDTIDDCKLVFTRIKNKIIIKTAAGECHFGYGVYADGTYHLEDSKNPSYFESRKGEKVYFDKTPPDKYLE